MLFFKDSQKTGKAAFIRREISGNLPNIFAKEGVSDKIIIEWLESDAKELQQAALTITENEKRLSASNSIEILMLKTADESIQYNCYKALCAIAGKENYPAWDPFFASKDKYIKEIKDLISSQQQNK